MMRYNINGVDRYPTTLELIDIQKSILEVKSAELSDEEKISLILGSIPVEKPSDGNDLPFKLGFKWVPVYDGNKFAWQLVPDPDAIGTEDNPIVYVDDGSIPLIDNAYYLVPDDSGEYVRNVYMSGEFVEF